MYIKPHHSTQPGATADPRDRRLIKRRHLIYYLRVWDLADGQVLGHLVDITTEGLMLISERQIPVGEEYELELRWNEADSGHPPIRFRVASRWSKPDLNPAFHDTGFALLDPNPQVLEPIRELIREYGFDD